MVTAMEDACPSGGQQETEDPAGQPDGASVSTQPSRGEDRGMSQVGGVGVDERLTSDRLSTV